MSSSAELAARLERGEAVCDAAPPDKRRDYTLHWLSLLNLYMTACFRENPDDIRLFNQERNVQPDKDYLCQTSPTSPSPDASPESQRSSNPTPVQSSLLSA